VIHAAELFHRELEYLSKSKTALPDVLVCAPPVEMFRFFDRGSDEEEEDETQLLQKLDNLTSMIC